MYKSQNKLSNGIEMTDGPFKATKLWNQIIYDFSTGISLKRHRRHLKAYENCFVACKAVDWLYDYLAVHKKSENKEISRQQAIQLLDKFLTYDIIEKVACKNTSCAKFKDNKDLYRLKNENIPYPHLENSRDNDEDVPYREEKVLEKQWSQSTTQSIDNSARLTPTKKISSSFDANSAQIWKNVILQHLNMMQPLVNSLLDARDINSSYAATNVTNLNKNGVVLIEDKSKDIPHWVMSAMKCLANWPNNSGNSLPRYPGFERDVFNLIREYFVNLDSPMIPSNFYPLIVSVVKETDLKNISQKNSQLYAKIGLKDREFTYDTNTSTPLASKISEIRRNGAQMKVKKDDPVFETVFLTQSPMTRILSHDALTSIFSSIASSDGSLDGSSSPQSIDAFNSYRRPIEASNLQHLATLPRNLRKQRLEGLKKFKLEKEQNKSSLCLMNFGCILQSPCEEGEYMMDKSVTNLRNFYFSSKHSPEPAYSNFIFRDKDSNTNASTEGEERVVNILNLVLLLIPPENRRHLHLLLRLLSRILKNSELKFHCNHSVSMEYYIIETFTRCIIHSGNEKTYNERAAQLLVSVMLKNTEKIFNIPSYVKYKVNSIINY
ncbi:DEP domain-containing protein 1B-like isoform X2 [Tetranychus urticae]|uniref:DEP domain-containing protein 1B-like isoform X2 n=1 Tax=Tetranychus urticae TaxID=32264 RepID=UPI00077BC8C7|nr:DEP domain-containing protein 1B-like isoform X2 [Tetranychus urticae]